MGFGDFSILLFNYLFFFSCSFLNNPLQTNPLQFLSVSLSNKFCSPLIVSKIIGNFSSENKFRMKQ